MLYISAEYSKPKRIQGAYISEEEISAVTGLSNNIIKQYQDGTLTVVEAQDEITAQHGLDGLGANATAMLARIVRGEDHYAMSSYVLRHTTNVGARSTWNVSDSNVDRIYTKDKLLTECQSTALWTNPLPTRLATKIEALDTNRPSDKTDYLWGWLKRGSTESTEANNRIGVTTEYWLDQWSQHEYATAT